MELPELSRALSPMERGFMLLDRARPFNGVPLLTVRGAITEAHLRAAIDRLQARHPLLRVRVDGDAAAGLPRFTTRGVPTMGLEIAERRGADDWLPLAQRELNRPFPPGEPLTRFHWLRGDGVHDLLYPQHHVSADAQSAVVLARDLLADLARLASGEPLPAVALLPLRPSLAELLPDEARGLGMLSTMSGFLLRGIGRTVLPKPRQLTPGARSNEVGGENRIVHRRLEPAEMERALARCRALGLTLNPLLCASVLAALGEAAGGGAARIGCFSAVSLRGKIDRAIEAEQGMYASQVTTFHQVGDGRALPALAAEVKRACEQRIAAGEPYLTMPRIGMFIPSRGDVVSGFARRVGALAKAACGVTNLGRIDLPSRFGPLTVERMSVAVGVSAVGSLSIAASSYAGALTLNFIYIEPLLERAMVERLADRTVAQITSL